MIFRLAISLLLLVPNVISTPATDAPTKSSKASKSSLVKGKPTARTLLLEDMFLDGEQTEFSYGNGVLDKNANPVTTKNAAPGTLWVNAGAVEESDGTETGEYWVACTVLKGSIGDKKQVVATKAMCDLEICTGATRGDCVYLKGTTTATFRKGGALLEMESFHATVIGGLGAYEGSIGSAADLEFEVPKLPTKDPNPPTTMTLKTTPFY